MPVEPLTAQQWNSATRRWEICLQPSAAVRLTIGASSDVEMANAKAAATRRIMWEHQCESEQTLMLVGSGEACSWCGKTEDFGCRPRHACEEDSAIRDQNVHARNADTVAA